MAVDRSGGRGEYTNAFEIHPSDSSELPFVTRALWIGVPGDLTVQFIHGDIAVFFNVGIGEIKFRVRKVFQTGTTCGDITGLY